MKIRSLIIVLTCALVNLQAYSQDTTNYHYIKGVIKDSLSGATQGLMTITLRDSSNKLIKTIINSENGDFFLDSIVSGAYKITILSVNFSPKIINLNVSKNSSTGIDLGSILITRAVKELALVKIVADKPLVKQDIDKISYNLQADADSKFSSVLDMMKKVPYLSLDGEGNILLKGSPTYRILIDGKLSSLVERNPKEVLKSIPASTIRSIEVMTNPPAKYDSEGLSGIINIITNRQLRDGYLGSLNIKHQGPTEGPQTGTSLSVKMGRMGISLLGGVSHSRYPQTENSLERSAFDMSSYLQQIGFTESKGYQGYLGLEISMQVDSMSLISGYFNINGGKTNGESQQRSSFIKNGEIAEEFTLGNNNKYNGNGIDASINYQLGFKKNTSRLFTISYKYSSYSMFDEGRILFEDKYNCNMPDYIQTNDRGTSEQTAQVDYGQLLGTVYLETGLKGILRKNISDFNNLTYNQTSNMFEPDPILSNKFGNDQDILAAYISYKYTISEWGFKGGVRVEQTYVTGDMINNGTSFKSQYFNILPTLAFTKKLKNKNVVSLGIVQRIKRPGIQQLNPFVDRTNPKVEISGNPDLKPVVLNAIQIGYGITRHVTVLTSVSYSFFNKFIQQVSFLNETTGITKTQYENTGRGKGAGFDLNIIIPASEKVNFSLNSNVSYAWIVGRNENSELKNEGMTYYFSPSVSYAIGRGWRASASANVLSRSLSLQTQSNALTSSSFNISKNLLNDKLTISASLNNPFNKFRMNRNVTSDPYFNQVATNRNYFRSYGISVNYIFGRLKEEIKKTGKSIKNDDVFIENSERK